MYSKVMLGYCKVRYRKVRVLHSSVEFSVGIAVHRLAGHSSGNAGFRCALQCVAQVEQSAALSRLSRVRHGCVWARRGTVQLCVVPAEYG